MLGMALRLYGLDADSLWVDEIRTLTTSQRDLLSILDFQARASASPPLLFIVTRLFLLLGESDFVLRLPAMLFGSLSVLLAYKVGEILWTRKEGLVGAFLLAVSAYHVQYSQEARHYALMVFLALLSLILLLKGLERNRKGLWVGFVLCTTLSLYNHYFAFLFLAADVVFAAWIITEAWLSHREKGDCTLGIRDSVQLYSPAQQALTFSLSLALIGLLYVPWFPSMLQQIFGRRVGWQGVGGEMAGVELSADYFHHLLSTYTGLDGGPLLLISGLFILGLVSCKSKHILLIALWLAIPILFTFLVSTEHIFAPRYATFALPIFLLTIARGVLFVTGLMDRLLVSRARDQKWPQVVTLTLTVVTFGALSVSPLKHYYATEKPDWRSAARYLKANMLPGDVVLADGESIYGRDYYRVEDGLSTYFGRYAMVPTPILPIKRGLGQAVAQNLSEGSGEIWTVIYHEDKLAAEVQNEVTVVDFEDVSIIRLGESSGDLLQDDVSMLEVLLDFLPAPEAHCDVHLALADIYLRTGDFQQAELQLNMASQVKPDTRRASRHLTRTRAELEQLSYATDEDIQHPLWRSVGLQVALLGYDLDPRSVRAGGTLDLTLWWQGLAEMDRDYTAFIHVVGPDDRIWAQQDILLKDGAHPTSTWQLGQTVREEYELQLPPDTPSGEYVVKAGIYYWETGERLPVWDGSGQRVEHDMITLASVTVTK